MYLGRNMDPTRVYPLLAPSPACPGCAAEGLRALHVFPLNHNKRRVTRQLNLALMGCEHCGLVSSHPLPSDDDLAAYYSDDSGWDERVVAHEAGIDERLARRRASHSRQLAIIKTHVTFPDGNAAPRALDFGCGIGGWLEALKADGWATFGIEPGPRAAAITSARHTMLETIPEDASFDLVVLHHTLEHLKAPGETMRRLAAAIKPGGAIWIEVPDLGSLGSHRDVDYVAGDKHICSFTSTSLRSLLALNGLLLIRHSNETGWGETATRKRRRLACVGLKVEDPLPLPEFPLETALEALREYGAGAAEPTPRPAPRALRRLARRVLR
jgi:SAM-dependent methyltransferase